METSVKKELIELARKVRIGVIESTNAAQCGHPGGSLSIAEIIPVPGSFYGFSPVSPDRFPADPAPFGHPTKIIVLDVRRKDERA